MAPRRAVEACLLRQIAPGAPGLFYPADDLNPMALPALNHSSLILQHRDRKTGQSGEIDVASRLMRLRTGRGRSVAWLAQAAGISPRRLQKIESGDTSPAIETLERLLAALGVSFADLFAMDESGPLSRRVLSPREEGRYQSVPGYRHRLLSAELLHKKMLPVTSSITRIEAGTEVRWEAHEGEAFVLVQKGCVTLLTEHYAPLVLHEGDSVYFDCSAAYRLCGEDTGAAEVVWLTSLT